MSVSVSNFLGLELSLAPKPSFFNNTHIINSFPFTEFLSPTPTSLFPHSKRTSNSNSSYKRRSITTHSFKSHTAHLNSTSTTSEFFYFLYLFAVLFCSHFLSFLISQNWVYFSLSIFWLSCK